MVEEAVGHKMHDFSFALDFAFDPEQARAEQFAPLLLHQACPDDDIEIPGFVLKSNEYHSAGRSGALTAGDDACAAGRCATGKRLQLRSGREPHTS